MADLKKIILVEDNHADRVSFCEKLENWGCHVITCHSMPDALKKIEEEKSSFIIVSYDSPGLSCPDFILEVKEKNPETDILVVGESASVDAAVSVMKNGAVDYIVKPVASDQLLLFAEAALNKENQSSDKVVKQNSIKKDSVKIITENAEMKRVLSLVEKIAASTASVLIQGESGTGKELFAKYLHEKSDRKNNPFIAINCAALPENLLESELFGHEKGAFTGAITKKAGKFELADNGTILLDEITEMQLHLQAKLLRVIQEREVDRVGGSLPVKINVRIVATTNRDILKVVEEGKFREDLYYRLNVIPIVIPPLRERWDDIAPLSNYFVKKFNAIDGRNVKCLTKEANEILSGLPLKGNVRELENIIQRAVLLSGGETITADDLFTGDKIQNSGEEDVSPKRLPDDILASPLKDVERRMIFHTLEKTGGNRTHAAKILEISVRTLRNKLNEYKERNISA